MKMDLNIIYTQDMQELYFGLLLRHDLDFAYVFTQTRLTHLYFRNFNHVERVTIKHVNFVNDVCEERQGQIQFASGEEFALFTSTQAELTKSCITMARKSFYSPTVKTVFENMPSRANLRNRIVQKEDVAPPSSKPKKKKSCDPCDEDAAVRVRKIKTNPADEAKKIKHMQDAMALYDVYEIDFTKHYPSILMELEKCGLPRFIAHDEYMTYDGHKIDPMTNYIVENLNGDLIYASNRYVRCWGRNLLEDEKSIIPMKYGIIAFCKPSCLIKPAKKNKKSDESKADNFEEAVKKVLASELPTAHCKTILNSTIGCMSKGTNTRTTSNYFTDERSCDTYYNDLLEKGEEVVQNTHQFQGKDIFQVVQSKTCRLTDGFYPISDLVLDTARLRLKQLYELADEFAPVIAVNTDAVFVKVKAKTFFCPVLDKEVRVSEEPDVECETIVKLTKALKERFGLKTHSYDFGKVTIEPASEDKRDRLFGYMPLTLNENCPHEAKLMYIDKMIPVQFSLENEWKPTDKDWHGMMDFNKLMFRGDFGGCGKTHMAVELAKKFTSTDRIAFVCSWNSLKHTMEDDGLNAWTSYGWFGMRPDMHEPKKPNGYMKIGFDVVIFDELNLNDQNMLNIIYKFMQNHPEVKFIATGDKHQCEPIDQALNNVQSQRDFIEDITNRMFPDVCRLTEVKRASCKEHLTTGFKHECKHCVESQAEFMRICQIPLQCMNQGQTVKHCLRLLLADEGITKSVEFVDTDKSVCYFNETRAMINKRQHFLHNTKDIFEGLELVCTRRVMKGSNCLVHKHDTVKVSEIREKGITIDTRDGEVDIDDDYIWRLFDYNHCGTAHSYQGRSEKVEMAVYDMFGNPYIGLGEIVVMLSRPRLPQDVVLVTKVIRKSAKDWKRTIKQHMEEDFKKNRPFDEDDFVTDEWVGEQLLIQKYKCEICAQVIDSPSINRLDNSKAHEKDNCRMSCHICNVSAGNNERVFV
jgi:hypothetical protein